MEITSSHNQSDVKDSIAPSHSQRIKIHHWRVTCQNYTINYVVKLIAATLNSYCMFVKAFDTAVEVSVTVVEVSNSALGSLQPVVKDGDILHKRPTICICHNNILSTLTIIHTVQHTEAASGTGAMTPVSLPWWWHSVIPWTTGLRMLQTSDLNCTRISSNNTGSRSCSVIR